MHGEATRARPDGQEDRSMNTKSNTPQAPTAREKLERFVANTETSKLYTTIRELRARITAPSTQNPEWIALMAVEREVRRRTDEFNATRPSDDLAWQLRAYIERPRADRDPVENISYDSMEAAIRARFPEADDASDEYLEAADLTAPDHDEHAHVRILLEVAGL